MLLGVNIDHIATLRNARGGVDPNLIEAALVCEKAGADGITVHLREDRRHTKDNDVYELKKILKTRLNLEMALTDEMQKIALDVLPECCCLVPEKRQEVTTEGGLDVANQKEYLKEFIKPLKEAGIIVSMFIDADEKQVEASSYIGADYIEMHTGCFSNAFEKGDFEHELAKLKKAAKLAQSLGLKVNAGHGLNYENVYLMKEIEDLCELNIGHSIISKAVFVGLADAIKQMLELMR